MSENIEVQKWWKRLVAAIVMKMAKHGIAELRVKRVGSKVIFELTPIDEIDA